MLILTVSFESKSRLVQRLFLWLLFCLVTLPSVPTTAQARDWLRAETPELVIYSDGYPLELKRWVRKVQNFDALLKARFGGGGDPAGAKLTIYLLEDGKAVSRLVGRKNLTGFYSASSEGSFALASRKPSYYDHQMSGQMSLFHEYTHHFTYRHLTGAYPAWFREGFAEYASTATFDRNWNAAFGLPAGPRLKHLRKKPIPIETILTASVEDFKPDKRARFYAWSWKLVHMLNSRPERTRQLARYLRLFGKGVGTRQAAASFGDLEQLESELVDYQPIRQSRQSSKAQPTEDTASEKVEIETVEIQVSSLDPLESRLIDLQLARLVKNRSNSGQAAIRALAAANPQNPAVQLEFALWQRERALESGSTDFSVAEAAARRAMAAKPDNSRAITIWAELAMRRLKADPAANPRQWAAVRGKLRAAIGMARSDPLVLMTYYKSFVQEQRLPDRLAHQAMERAFKLQPESYEVRLSHIFSLSMQGRFRQARTMAQTLASDPHAAKLGRKTLASLASIEKAAGTRGPPATAAPPRKPPLSSKPD